MCLRGRNQGQATQDLSDLLMRSSVKAVANRYSALFENLAKLSELISFSCVCVYVCVCVCVCVCVYVYASVNFKKYLK